MRFSTHTNRTTQTKEPLRFEPRLFFLYSTLAEPNHTNTNTNTNTNGTKHTPTRKRTELHCPKLHDKTPLHANKTAHPQCDCRHHTQSGAGEAPSLNPFTTLFLVKEPFYSKALTHFFALMPQRGIVYAQSGVGLFQNCYAISFNCSLNARTAFFCIGLSPSCLFSPLIVYFLYGKNKLVKSRLCRQSRSNLRCKAISPKHCKSYSLFSLSP